MFSTTTSAIVQPMDIENVRKVFADILEMGPIPLTVFVKQEGFDFLVKHFKVQTWEGHKNAIVNCLHVMVIDNLPVKSNEGMVLFSDDHTEIVVIFTEGTV